MAALDDVSLEWTGWRKVRTRSWVHVEQCKIMFYLGGSAQYTELWLVYLL